MQRKRLKQSAAMDEENHWNLSQQSQEGFWNISANSWISTSAMEKKRGNGLGYGWAVAAGGNASMAAVIAKATSSSQVDGRFQLLGYAGVVLLNVTMWSCYVNSLKVLTSLQATVVNFATNFLVSGLTGLFLFKESLHFQQIKHYTGACFPCWQE